MVVNPTPLVDLSEDLIQCAKSVYGIDTSITRSIPIAVIKGGKPVQLTVVSWPPGV